MKHLLDFGSELTTNYLVMTIAADEFFALFAAKMTHIRAATQDFTGTGDLESFHDDFSGLLFSFGHRF